MKPRGDGLIRCERCQYCYRPERMVDGRCRDEDMCYARIQHKQRERAAVKAGR